MEVTALCLRLLMSVLFLLSARDQKVDSVFLSVEPNKQQFFEYEPLTFHCEGVSTEWRLVHESKGENVSCRVTSKVASTKSSCTISTVYPEDSGEYWCKAGESSSNHILITVTGGSVNRYVILESPVLPVMEGEAVTLRCRNKTPCNLTAGFYKDGLLMGKRSTREMTIHSVSKSDEGHYKCRIFDVGESPESLLSVRVQVQVHKETTSSSPTPWVVVTVLLMVLLLVVGLRHLGKRHWHRVLLYLSTLTPGSGSAEDQTVSVEASAADASKVTYAVVRKIKKKTDEDELMSRPVYYTLGLAETQQQEPGVSSMAATSVPSSGANPPLPEDPFYSTIQLVAE